MKEQDAREQDAKAAPAMPRGVQTLGFWFYGVAATTSMVGQIIVGVANPPWPEWIPLAVRILLVLPVAAVIELGGVFLSAFADARQRMNERALTARIISVVWVAGGVAINITGHWEVPYLVAVFAGTGAAAYTLWLIHSAARRRDALRDSGEMARSKPIFGWRQRRREPAATRLAGQLAMEWEGAEPLTRAAALAMAREQLRTDARRASVAKALEAVIKAAHPDELSARVALAVYDLDRLADEIADQADYAGWATVIGRDLVPVERTGTGKSATKGTIWRTRPRRGDEPAAPAHGNGHVPDFGANGVPAQTAALPYDHPGTNGSRSAGTSSAAINGSGTALPAHDTSSSGTGPASGAGARHDSGGLLNGRGDGPAVTNGHGRTPETRYGLDALSGDEPRVAQVDDDLDRGDGETPVERQTKTAAARRYWDQQLAAGRPRPTPGELRAASGAGDRLARRLVSEWSREADDTVAVG